MFFVTLISACASRQQGSAKHSGKQEYRRVAESKLKNQITYTKSPGGKYMLCASKDATRITGTNLMLMVYDLKKDKIVFELKVGEGSVKWYDKRHLLVSATPGAVLKDQDRDIYSTIYNVLDGTSKPKLGN